jgi:hypothetical protein
MSIFGEYGFHAIKMQWKFLSALTNPGRIQVEWHEVLVGDVITGKLQ